MGEERIRIEQAIIGRGSSSACRSWLASKTKSYLMRQRQAEAEAALGGSRLKQIKAQLARQRAERMRKLFLRKLAVMEGKV